ncbi:MAG: long-chain-fatty-acid--CoA ligase [Candidatus Freyarchaeota archaeon]
MLLGDIPRRNARLYPDKIAVIDGENEFTFGQFNERVNRLANSIIDFGLDSGDRFAVLSRNNFQFVELYFAAAKAGRPIVPVNYRLKEGELSHVLNDSEARILFFEKDFYPLIEKLEADTVEHLVCLDGDLQNSENYENLISKGSKEEPNEEIDENDVAILGYTGGTTGLPKGVLTTHRNVITSCYNLCVENELKMAPGKSFLNAPPVFHAGDAMGMFAFSFIGGTNVMMNFTSVESPLINIQKYRVTHALLVPTMIIWMLQLPNLDSYDLSSLEVLFYGTAPMPLEALKKALKVFKCNFCQVYGSAETFVPISILKPSDHVVEGSEEEMKRMLSAGREVQGVEVKIVDDNDNEVEKGEVGEIIVKGKNVMKGYWKKPELTKEALKNGWYHTGDLGRRDAANYIYIVDRKKDMIISGGENIYPIEIENVLFKHPAVADAAVIGVPDEEWGESVKAFVVKKGEVTEEELIEFCGKYLAGYKKPKSIEFVEALPKSSVGKVQKHVMREPYWKGRERKV